jgi:predicted metalloprotease with PDZ domain
VRVAAPSRMRTPAYEAGLGEGDVLRTLGDTTIAAPGDVDKALETHKVGDTLDASIRRAGRELTLRITLAADPQQEIVTVESTGGALTPDQQQFRDAWITSRVQ